MRHQEKGRELGTEEQTEGEKSEVTRDFKESGHKEEEGDRMVVGEGFLKIRKSMQCLRRGKEAT